ncbi:MAG: linear amide C-N hydrolase, partial [Erysipelotrichales bacterium]
EQKSVNASFHVLSSVDIPKGSVKTQRGPDYTQYTACMVSNTATYYFKTYDNYQINKFSLLDHDLNSKEVLKWDIAQEENYNEII